MSPIYSQLLEARVHRGNEEAHGEKHKQLKNLGRGYRDSLALFLYIFCDFEMIWKYNKNSWPDNSYFTPEYEKYS